MGVNRARAIVVAVPRVAARDLRVHRTAKDLRHHVGANPVVLSGELVQACLARIPAARLVTACACRSFDAIDDAFGAISL